MSGTLYVIATPIGNLDDISIRALKLLKQVDLIVAEDTRHSLILLQKHAINNKLTSLHAHNEKEKTAYIISKLLEGLSIALISDAGTPLIQDPGVVLIQAAHQANITVSPIPGPCALIAALSASGLGGHKFIFAGFMALKSAARQSQLRELKAEQRPVIFYEVPHRLISSLEDLLAVYGPMREILLAREITKLFETIRRAPIAELLAFVKADPNQCKGEMVIVIAGAHESATEEALTSREHEIFLQLVQVMPIKTAVQLGNELFHKSKKTLYALALSLKET